MKERRVEGRVGERVGEGKKRGRVTCQNCISCDTCDKYIH